MLAPQAVLVGISIFLICIVILMNVATNAKTRADAYTAAGVVLLLTIPLICVKVYAMQCVVYGNCSTFGWILASVSFSAAMLYAGAYVLKIYKHKKEESIDSKK